MNRLNINGNNILLVICLIIHSYDTSWKIDFCIEISNWEYIDFFLKKR